MSLTALVKETLSKEGWPIDPTSDGTPVIRTGFRGETARWPVFVSVDDQTRAILVISVLDANVPVSRRREMAEFVTRANFSLKFGSLEMNFDDGEVRYRTSLNGEGLVVTPPAIMNLLYWNVGTLSQFYPALMMVSFGEVDPTTALERMASRLTEQRPA